MTTQPSIWSWTLLRAALRSRRSRHDYASFGRTGVETTCGTSEYFLAGMLSPAHQTSSYEQQRKQRAPPAPRGRFQFRSEHLPSKLVGIGPSSASLLRPATKFRPALRLTAGSTHPLTLVPRRWGFHCRKHGRTTTRVSRSGPQRHSLGSGWGADGEIRTPGQRFTKPLSVRSDRTDAKVRPASPTHPPAFIHSLLRGLEALSPDAGASLPGDPRLPVGGHRRRRHSGDW